MKDFLRRFLGALVDFPSGPAEPGPKYCPRCGTSNGPYANYCTGCGMML